MAGCGSGGLRLLGQGLALPHSYEKAQRSAGADGETSRQGECTRGQARAPTVPASTQVEVEPGAAGRPPRNPAGESSLHLRISVFLILRRRRLTLFRYTKLSN